MDSGRSGRRFRELNNSVTKNNSNHFPVFSWFSLIPSVQVISEAFFWGIWPDWYCLGYHRAISDPDRIKLSTSKSSLVPNWNCTFFSYFLLLSSIVLVFSVSSFVMCFMYWKTSRRRWASSVFNSSIAQKNSYIRISVIMLSPNSKPCFTQHFFAKYICPERKLCDCQRKLCYYFCLGVF